jgi:phosphoglycolate phosphatase-like HAD superfamily hydrolase
MNRLAIFDIDGTLTDTNGVDDEAYRNAVASALGVSPELIDWSGALHVTDAEIFRHLCSLHKRGEPSAELMARAKSQFIETLTATLDNSPDRFVEVAGASGMLRRVAEEGWRIAVATGGWGPSARLKLLAAGIEIDSAVLASADDGGSRADIVELARRRAESFYGTRFERAVSVGDGVWDADTAAALELPFIGIANGAKAERLRDAGAGNVFADYRDIDAFLDALINATVPRGVLR